jgi:serine/threonine-protein kinase
MSSTAVPSRHCLQCAAAIPAGAITCPACGAEAPTQIAVEEPLSRPTAADASGEGQAELQAALGPGFEVRRLIGLGGFGQVWEAWDVRLGRAVAVKVLRPELAASATFRNRFRREARAIARLRHPGIVPIYHVGETEKLLFFLMPLVEGVTLSAMLREQGRVEPEEASRILIEAALALREAHRHGIVHRDLKPGNFMLEGPDRRVLLMDFGIALSRDPDREITGAGLVMGSPDYVSPEQATGDPHLDERSDLYSLGVVGYRMLAGRLPFASTTAREALAHHVNTPPAPLAAVAPVPPDLADAVMRCLAKRPEDRWQSADELLAALGRRTSTMTVAAIAPAAAAAAGAAPAARGAWRRVVPAVGLVLVAAPAAAWLAVRVGDRRHWEAAADSVVVIHGTARRQLLALAAAFRADALDGSAYLTARDQILAAADARIGAAFGPILDARDGWTPAARARVDSALHQTWSVTLPGGEVAILAAATAGCVLREDGAARVLEDRLPGDNCWWAFSAPPPVAVPAEYTLTFEEAEPLGADAGVGLGWCPGAAACRVLFLWPGRIAESAVFVPGVGLRDRRAGAPVPPLAGGHRLRVRVDSNRVRAWLDERLVLESGDRQEARAVADAGAVRVVVQNAAVRLGSGGLVVVGGRP